MTGPAPGPTRGAGLSHTAMSPIVAARVCIRTVRGRRARAGAAARPPTPGLSSARGRTDAGRAAAARRDLVARLALSRRPPGPAGSIMRLMISYKAVGDRPAAYSGFHITVTAKLNRLAPARPGSRRGGRLGANRQFRNLKRRSHARAAPGPTRAGSSQKAMSPIVAARVCQYGLST